MHFHLFPFLKDEISVTNVWHNTPTHSGHNKYENLYSFWLWGKVKTRTMHNRYNCALSFIFFQCSIHTIVPCHSLSSSVPYIQLCPVIHFLPVFHTYNCALSLIFFQCSIHFYVTAWPYLNSTNIFIMIIKHWWWLQDFRGWVNTYLFLVWAWWKHLCSSKHAWDQFYNRLVLILENVYYKSHKTTPSVPFW